MDERRLIAGARQGDEAAWEALVRQHQEAAFRLAYLLLGNAADAEEVAQDAFLRAAAALSRFDADRPLRPWLLRITANLARNRRRAIGRYLAAVRRFFQAASDPTEAVAAAPGLPGWEAEALWQAVRRLGAQDQEVIYLRYFLELSEAETAEALGVARGTVKSRLSRALGRLRALVAAEFPLLWEGQET